MKLTVVSVFLLVPVLLMAEVQRGGGGRTASRSGGATRAAGTESVNRDVSRTSVRSSQDVNRNVTRNGDLNVNQNVNVNRNDVNVNRNVEVDRDLHVNGNVYGGYDRWGHPIAAGAVVGVTAGVAAAATSAALGSTVAALPPACSTVVVNEIAYSQCGSTWYQPYYNGTNVQYTVVGPPQ